MSRRKKTRKPGRRRPRDRAVRGEQAVQHAGSEKANAPESDGRQSGPIGYRVKEPVHPSAGSEAELLDSVMAERSPLLGQARIHWLFGEWQELINLDEASVVQDQERGRLAILLASAYQRLDDLELTRRWAHRALDWGCDREEVAGLLAAGVHHTLGRVALLNSDPEATERHFRQNVEAAGLKDTPTGTLARARAGREASDLGLDTGDDDEAPPSASDEAPDGFYRAFEDRFRGSRELIKSRVTVYLPFVRPVGERNPQARTLDLGCGRGEWLEVLRDAGLPAHGVDTDPVMLAACRERDLSVEEGDAVAALERQANDSLSCVSLFHLAEHLPFEELRRLVREARRALVPEGLLIMETPNPENLTVGSCNFYMDPTHRNPLPPPLLAFVPEYYGFERVKVLRLQEDPALRNQSQVSVADLMQGVSPDYAVVAQKHRPVELTSSEQRCWEQEYGIDFASLRQRLATD